MKKSQNQNAFSTFSQTSKATVSPAGPFCRPKRQISLPSFTSTLSSTREIPTLSCIRNLKEVPLSGGASPRHAYKSSAKIDGRLFMFFCGKSERESESFELGPTTGTGNEKRWTLRKPKRPCVGNYWEFSF